MYIIKGLKFENFGSLKFKPLSGRRVTLYTIEKNAPALPNNHVLLLFTLDLSQKAGK